MHRPSLCFLSMPWFLVAPILTPSLPGQAASLFSDPPTAAEVGASKVFEEPLRPVGMPSDPETRALAKALDAYVAAGRLEDLGPLDDFLAAYPASAWQIPLLVNLGLVDRHVGRITAALEAWGAAWEAGKDLRDPVAGALANRALGELLEANAGLGRAAALKVLVQAAEGRPLSGVVTEKLSGAKESLAYMELSPQTAFRCGPTALAFLKATRDPLAFVDPAVRRMYSTAKGTSLAMNAKWAAQIGLALQMARREPGADVPVPCVLHLRTGHFAAVTFARNGRYLIQDPFLGDAWVTSATLDQEASGYALVASGTLPKGWTPVAEPEGGTVWGGGAWGPGRPDDTRPDSVKLPSTLPPVPGLAVRPAYHADLVSLNLDFPVVAYTPVRGPRVDFTATYNQREYGQPQLFDYCNFGQKWTFSFLACLKDDSTNPDADVTVCNPGGGGQVFHARGDGSFLPENNTQAVLTRLGGVGYSIQYPSGRKEFYDLADRAWGLRRIVLTRIQDRFGNTANLTWDPLLRLTAIRDATGRITSVAYETPDPLLVSKVTDPFGAVTRFQYDPVGRLTAMVDPQGRTTTFTYGTEGSLLTVPQDFLRVVAGPQGGYTFRAGETLVGPSYRRWLEATAQGSGLERLEGGAGYAYEIPPERLPLAAELDPGYHPLAFRFRESFFWPVGTYDSRKPDYHPAGHIRWGHGPGAFSSGLVLSQRGPSASRHWYIHTGDFWDGVFHLAWSADYPLTSAGALKPGARLVKVLGTQGDASFLAPVYDGNRALVTRDYKEEPDRTSSCLRRDYDLQGRLVGETGPSGVRSTYVWDATTGDLKGATVPGPHGVHRFRYDAHHRLLSWNREGRPPLTFSYRSDGMLQGWREGWRPAWTLRLDAEGRLLAAQRSGKTWSLTWDKAGRVAGVRDPRGALRPVATEAQRPLMAVQGPWTEATKPVEPLGIGASMEVPRGCEAALASVLDGANGPFIQRLLALP